MNLDFLIDKKKWLAPLAGFTDQAFRVICKENGADVLTSEMISVDGLYYNSDKTKKMMVFSDKERPYGIQLFGSDPDIFSKACDSALELEPDFIDINMGCPVKKVVKRDAGSALMKNPDLACRIVEATKRKLKNLPLSVKIRAGWTVENINAVDFSKKMQNAGADIIIVHPRTRSQFFEGKSDWNIIKEVKENVNIPVVGNGDIQNLDDINSMYSETNCDSIMIGRGAIGNPWIFRDDLSGRTVDNKMKLTTIIRHYELIAKFKNERLAVREMRKQMAQYTKGLVGGSKLRKFINSSDSLQEIYKELAVFFNG